MKEKFEAALNFDVFAGDFGEPGDTAIVNELVKNRKDHKCSHCKEICKKGEISRSLKEVIDSEFRRYRFCQLCLEAMIKEEESYLNDEEPINYFYDRFKPINSLEMI
jgi:hypothetical protein